MTPQATAFLVVVWSLVIGCTLYCFKKLLTSGRKLDSSDE